MPTRQLSGEKRETGGLTTSIRSIRQGGMGGDRAGRQGWLPGRRAGKGVGLGGRRPAGGRTAEGNHYFLICLYTYMFIFLYLYMIISLYEYMCICLYRYIFLKKVVASLV